MNRCQHLASIIRRGTLMATVAAALTAVLSAEHFRGWRQLFLSVATITFFKSGQRLAVLRQI